MDVSNFYEMVQEDIDQKVDNQYDELLSRFITVSRTKFY